MNTQSIKLAVGAALLALGTAPAFAQVMVTPGGAITAQGSTSLTAGGTTIACTTTLMGTVTTGGGVTIGSAAFSGGDPRCQALVALNLPWSGQFDSASQLTLSGVQIAAPLAAINCGPDTIQPGYMNNPSTVNLNGTSLDNCAISGTLQITPDQTVQ